MGASLRSGILITALLALTPGSSRADASESALEVSGRAFGTTWSVQIPARDELATERIASELAAVLACVDAQMSTWRDDSELSRFNASRSTDWISVSPETVGVVALALDVYRRSRGAFDPSVGPLVTLWGFGPGPPRVVPPAAAEIRAARERVGATALAVRAEPPALRKDRPDLTLDLSGVAKGFAVDALATRLRELGVDRFLIELGGELRAGPAGQAWRVGIERPEPDAARLAWTLPLRNAALATSGDYRRFFTWKGRRFAHLIDPRSGWPVSHGPGSVSVLATSAARADAWATALLVLGPEAGPRLAEREGLAALFANVIDGGLEIRSTGAFAGLRTD